MTLELLEGAVRLTHPDRHPDRVEQATRVTAELLALKPFVLPKPPSNASTIVQPPPLRVSVTPLPPPHAPHNGYETDQSRTVAEPSYPCEVCRDTVPYYYCDACREKFEIEHSPTPDATRRLTASG